MSADPLLKFGRVAVLLAAWVSASMLFAGCAAAQYRAGIGCSAWKIDQVSAASSIEDFECLCFNKCKSGSTPARPFEPPPAKYLFYEGKDIDGNDLAIQRSSSLELCSSACKERSGCRAFSYDKWNRWCFLKDTIPSEIRVEPNSIVAVISTASPRVSSEPLVIEKYPNAKFVDAPYRNVTDVSFNGCSLECERDANCEVFTHSSRSRQCELFRRPSEYFHQTGSNRGDYNSGVKRQKPPTD